MRTLGVRGPTSWKSAGSSGTYDLQGGSLSIDVIQPSGKGPMPGPAWLNGRRGTGGRIDPAPE